MQQTSVETVTAQRITLARRQADMNQTDLAKAVQASRSTISRWEQGRGHSPTIAELERIAIATNVSLAWLIGVQS